MTVEHVLRELDPEQRAAVEAPWGPVCVLAGAGSGKTRTLTSRIAVGCLTGDVQAAAVLAVTFTARAAGEMRARLRDLGVPSVQARTFHAAALRQLRFFWPDVIGGSPPNLLAQKAPVIAEAASRCRVRSDRTIVRDLSAEVEWAKVSEVAPEAYAEAAQHAGRAVAGLPATEVARIFTAYEEAKRGRGLIDFEDVLLLTCAMLNDDDAMARNVRRQYRHFLVDEYQDVSPVQQRLLQLWLGDRDDLTVVGDAAQTIYSFSGAEPTFLLSFPKRFPHATVVRLERTYRCSPQVVEVANRLLAAGARADSAPRLVLRSQRPQGPKVVVRRFDDELAEAEGVADLIASWLAVGVGHRDVAVLYRINAQSEAFEEALTARGMPYVVRGSERFFDRAEVRQAITLLRGAARAGDDMADATPLPDQVRTVLSAAGQPVQAPTGPGAARERWESLAALGSLAEQFEPSNDSRLLVQFVAELDQRAALQHAPALDGVTLSTLHAAKGLEWDAVVVAGLVEGTLPISYATTPAQAEEERRLLYVGVTRARRHLALTWAAARQPGGRAARRRSSLLDQIDVDGAAGNARPRRRPARGHAASCRTCGGRLTAAQRRQGQCSTCGPDVDVVLYERLREWRRAEADAAGVPAFVVFTDATLSAIAGASPTDSASLARIPGVGVRKLERYASGVLAVVAHHAPTSRR